MKNLTPTSYRTRDSSPEIGYQSPSGSTADAVLPVEREAKCRFHHRVASSNRSALVSNRATKRLTGALVRVAAVEGPCLYSYFPETCFLAELPRAPFGRSIACRVPTFSGDFRTVRIRGTLSELPELSNLVGASHSDSQDIPAQSDKLKQPTTSAFKASRL
jgi:hypothetical protein